MVTCGLSRVLLGVGGSSFMFEVILPFYFYVDLSRLVIISKVHVSLFAMFLNTEGKVDGGEFMLQNLNMHNSKLILSASFISAFMFLFVGNVSKAGALGNYKCGNSDRKTHVNCLRGLLDRTSYGFALKIGKRGPGGYDCGRQAGNKTKRKHVNCLRRLLDQHGAHLQVISPDAKHHDQTTSPSIRPADGIVAVPTHPTNIQGDTQSAFCSTWRDTYSNIDKGLHGQGKRDNTVYDDQTTMVFEICIEAYEAGAHGQAQKSFCSGWTAQKVGQMCARNYRCKDYGVLTDRDYYTDTLNRMCIEAHETGAHYEIDSRDK